jgi:hypothetical protein
MDIEKMSCCYLSFFLSFILITNMREEEKRKEKKTDGQQS